MFDIKWVRTEFSQGKFQVPKAWKMVDQFSTENYMENKGGEGGAQWFRKSLSCPRKNKNLPLPLSVLWVNTNGFNRHLGLFGAAFNGQHKTVALYVSVEPQQPWRTTVSRLRRWTRSSDWTTFHTCCFAQEQKPQICDWGKTAQRAALRLVVQFLASVLPHGCGKCHGS